MIKAYSQRLMPPFWGQVQIVESDKARAITLDGIHWEFHFIKLTNASRGSKPTSKKGFFRAVYLNLQQLQEIASQTSDEFDDIDERILALVAIILDSQLPFPPADRYEFWVLDSKEKAPLALIFSCSDAEQMAAFPQQIEWTALPAAVMPIELTEAEQQRSDAPVNYRVERLVANRAGFSPKTEWFKRESGDEAQFPPCLLREDWSEEEDSALVQRYVQRLSTRLLMLPGLSASVRGRLELAAKAYALEVERFYAVYPEIINEKLLHTIRAEAQLRLAAGEKLDADQRQGVLYI